MCRAAIHHRLGLYAPKKVDQLPIPETLKTFLHFPEHMREKFYVEKSLSEKECPFDCSVMCTIRTCPTLDISFSDDSDQDIEFW